MSNAAKPKYEQDIERLQKTLIGWLATTRPDGNPNIAPVWFLWNESDSTILIFSQPNKQKLRNIRHNPHVMFGTETDEESDAVMVEGTAEIVDDPTVKPTLPAYAAKYLAGMKNLGWAPEDMAKRYSVAIRITPTKFRSNR